MSEKYITLRNESVPMVVRSYKTSRNIKAYYKGNVLYISKPKYVSGREIDSFIRKYEDYLYDEYKKIKSDKSMGVKKWKTGEKLFYKGKDYTVFACRNTENNAEIKVDDKNKFFYINTPWGMEEEERTELVLKLIKSLFKTNTEAMLSERLPYWSEVTGIDYAKYRVHDATTRYGSCVKSKKSLNFTSRLIMLPTDMVDAIIVHELCHIEQANHSAKFYELVEKFIPNYREIDKWLKRNGNILII